MADEINQENFSSPPASLDLPSSSQGAPPSSPLAPTTSNRRPKRRPPITPRRFTRFFNPPQKPSAPSRALRELTTTINNGVVPHPFFGDASTSRSKKRRKVSLANDESIEPTPASSPPPRLSDSPEATCPSSASLRKQHHQDPIDSYCRPIRRAKKQLSRPDWRTQVADFWTSEADWHDYQTSWGGNRLPPMPFCAAACNTNSLMAFGDESGCVRMVETAKGDEDTFQRTHVEFAPHMNAIMDLAFSSDDLLLATASGDQTGRIIDMRTQETTSILAHSASTVKQVAFQPGNDSIVATCSRNAAVNIWDLRCQTAKPQIALTFDPPHAPGASATTRYGSIVASIPPSVGVKRPGPAHTGPTAPATPTSRGPGSVTCLSFLSSSRPHHVVTATDSNAQISLWDIRRKRRSPHSNSSDLTLSTSASLSAHVKHRDFGISSLAINTDASRLYSLCKDNTVYAYSTSQLVLGSASYVFNSSESRSATLARGPRQSSHTGTTSPGPLYGLRHPRLQISSFYVRAAVRKTSTAHNGAELLAVGSGDKCAILFPTDESMLRDQCPHLQCQNRFGAAVHHTWPVPSKSASDTEEGLSGSGPSDERLDERERRCHRRLRSQLTQPLVSDGVPLYSVGAPLVAAHEREVTGVAWAHGGELVTIGDDYKICLWHEDDRHGFEKAASPRPATDLRWQDVRDRRRFEEQRSINIDNGIHFSEVEASTHGWSRLNPLWDNDCASVCSKDTPWRKKTWEDERRFRC